VDERYTLKVEREIPGPIAAVFDAWLDAATMAQWMSPAPDISVEAASDPVVGGRVHQERRIEMMVEIDRLWSRRG
jgi:uncharacterized protein YndB with AHSA1/START domain